MSESISTKKEKISYDLAELLMIFATRFAKPFERHSKCEYSPLQVHILYYLGFLGPHTMTQLRESLKISKQQMTPLVDKLISADLVERRHDEKDRRVITLCLSENGHAFLKAVKLEGMQILIQMMQDLPDCRLEQLGRATSDLLEVLELLPEYKES